MGVSISEQSFQYVGILNGVMYRIDPSSGRSLEPMFGAEPFRKWSSDAGVAASAFLGSSGAVIVAPVAVEAAPAAPAASAASAERIVEPSNLFPRSGGEPLRAGHPDLWALLVAGTCLEGSSFSHP